MCEIIMFSCYEGVREDGATAGMTFRTYKLIFGDLVYKSCSANYESLQLQPPRTARQGFDTYFVQNPKLCKMNFSNCGRLSAANINPFENISDLRQKVPHKNPSAVRSSLHLLAQV